MYFIIGLSQELDLEKSGKIQEIFLSLICGNHVYNLITIK